jgi:hypothetical protein
MKYFWRGRKAHMHHQVTMGATGREKGKPTRVETVLIQPGDVFEPSPEEIRAFKDLMEPYGETLRAMPAGLDAPAAVAPDDSVDGGMIVR